MGRILITRRGNLPINARIDERWTRLHAARNVLNIAGFVFTSLGALSETRSM